MAYLEFILNRYVDFYTTCISQELGTSVNVIDKIVMKLFDLTNADRLKTVFRAVCEETKGEYKNIKLMAYFVIFNGMSD